MKTNLLIPNQYRPFGWLLMLPALALGIAQMYFEFELGFLDFSDSWLAEIYRNDFFGGDLNFTDELATIGMIAGLMVLVFTAEKIEDEWSSSLRLRALSWAVWIHYIILTVAVLLVHGTAFFNVLVYNIFTLLVVFGLRFRYLIWKANRSGEEI
jgi:hypothetical protein